MSDELPHIAQARIYGALTEGAGARAVEELLGPPAPRDWRQQLAEATALRLSLEEAGEIETSESPFDRMKRQQCRDCKDHEIVGDKDINDKALETAMEYLVFCLGCFQWVSLKRGVAMYDWRDYAAVAQLS